MYLRAYYRAFFVAVIPFVLLSCSSLDLSSVRPPRTRPVVVYNVEPGDTLMGIAERYSLSVDDIVSLNEISPSRGLVPGERIRLPDEVMDREHEASNKVVSSATSGGSSSLVGALSWPVKDGKGITSPFGERRRSFHEGIDIGGAQGTPIYAAHSGIVTYSGNRMRGYGNMVVIKSGPLVTVYGHNRKNYVKKGDRVERGEKIAALGRTGRATGPHLHFETRIKNSEGKYVAVNPLLFFEKRYSVSAWDPNKKYKS